MDRRSNQVARELRERGAGPGDRVAILAERGPELLPGLLGILKAGAAYVPVDPGYPPSRVRLLLEDCGAKLVLRGAHAVQDPPTGAPVLRISELYRGSSRSPGRSAGPADVAYTIYTSGSTGRPKGVMVEHPGQGLRLFSRGGRVAPPVHAVLTRPEGVHQLPRAADPHRTPQPRCSDGSQGKRAGDRRSPRGSPDC
ncbi:AMP-binding protein [Streptomyces sundarbansensis]